MQGIELPGGFDGVRVDQGEEVRGVKRSSSWKRPATDTPYDPPAGVRGTHETVWPVPRGTDRNVFDRRRAIRRVLRPSEAARVRRFGRSVLSLAFRAPVLLLHTTGRTSGVDRTTTLAYDVDEDRCLSAVPVARCASLAGWATCVPTPEPP